MIPVRGPGRRWRWLAGTIVVGGTVNLASACSPGQGGSAGGGSTDDDAGRGAGSDTPTGSGGPGSDGSGGSTPNVGSEGGARPTPDGASPDDGTPGDAGETDSQSGSSHANPFACKFAWGEPVPSGSLSADTWLQFVTNWAGSEIQASGSISTFSNGGFLSQVGATNLVPAYYTYLIGFYGHANNLPDQNCCGGSSCVTCTASQPNLSTGAAYLLIGDPTGANAPCHSTTAFCDKNLIVQAYAYYAQQTQKAWPSRPLVWLIEGDFIQYAASTQVASLTGTSGASAALSYTQLGQLAALIAGAIKSNMPKAIVAFDDSGWISDAERPLYWQGIAQAHTDFDMVWTTGVGNHPPFVNAGTMPSDYNGMTATYSWLHGHTGKTILVDESAGASQQADTWSNQSAAAINALIGDGVVAVNVSGAPSTYRANVSALQPHLDSTCP